MSNNNALKTFINNTIYENNTQQITGAIMNTVLNSIVNTLGAGYQFAGVANVGMNPSEPDARVFYLASAGIYTNFGGIEVPQYKLGVLKWDTSWHLETIDGLGGGSNLTGYTSVASVSELPEVGQPTLGYLIGTSLYLYVGEGGDTADGKYQNCGPFRGPQGNEGGDGVGITDISQIEQSYENGGINIVRITTTDGNHYDVNIRNGKSSAGLFPDVATLNAQRPNPSVGEYAFVGSGFPAELYVCNTEGTWTDSGEQYGGDSIDLTAYATKAEVGQLEAEVDEKFDREQNTDTLCIVDGNGNIIAQIDANGVNTVDVRVKIDGELVSVKSLLATLNEGVSTLNEGLATEKLRAETEEAKKLDKVIDDDALVIMDENGYIIARIDASGIHSAQDKHAVACMVLGESYYPTSAPTRDSSGNITHANVMFGTGVAGSLDITYANNNASQVVVHYGNYTYTISITRDAQGNVTTVSIN